MSAAVAKSAVKSRKDQKKVATKLTIDVSAPSLDGIFDISAYEKYLHDRIKVAGRTSNLSDSITISCTETVLTITVSPNVQFAKRYLKYLTKKYLKKNQLRDWLRVVSSGKTAYTVKYFNIANAEDEE
ncbi:hypothetical protein BASA50_002588 [Batrachochytrium salamandrivorans]|uniref:Large ribosomal subunit protein eL22 n=1 Tax=Batrachochytrium salamandrivorans TaxID=1357716 RepID=A0ABQ8FNN9_9FUNG|nr:hypothetical protein BASA60_009266 [Batrachochytrium salamandrivorans]KAH6574798.1 hypothetical protein BASA62_002285 [Batrachochytrium salamandrivorans]KAH6579390.1 hypothetical protein BASA61_010273 [Batrachochytrium salamandrivorans]KAH6599999.1 hypothetical protein BASA50_002588 [Batrachochytrium salamandrivorans]KAH9271275.1 hypothetical protein BASA83_006598 [Batrachochytrium salamandrivorans]